MRLFVMGSHAPWDENLPLADAALLCVPFTILALQAVRADGYDGEKVGFIGLFIAVIVGAHLTRLMRARDLPRLQVRQLLHSPLSIAVLGVFSVAILSTLTSLSPSLSFWGEPSSPQGLLTL